MASKVSQTKRDCPFYIAIVTLTVEIRGRGAEELIVKIWGRGAEEGQRPTELALVDSRGCFSLLSQIWAASSPFSPFCSQAFLTWPHPTPSQLLIPKTLSMRGSPPFKAVKPFITCFTWMLLPCISRLSHLLLQYPLMLPYPGYLTCFPSHLRVTSADCHGPTFQTLFRPTQQWLEFKGANGLVKGFDGPSLYGL